eukprot:PhF_6_TR4412/c0_g1_i1/m.5957
MYISGPDIVVTEHKTNVGRPLAQPLPGTSVDRYKTLLEERDQTIRYLRRDVEILLERVDSLRKERDGLLVDNRNMRDVILRLSKNSSSIGTESSPQHEVPSTSTPHNMARVHLMATNHSRGRDTSTLTNDSITSSVQHSSTPPRKVVPTPAVGATTPIKMTLTAERRIIRAHSPRESDSARNCTPPKPRESSPKPKELRTQSPQQRTQSPQTLRTPKRKPPPPPMKF